MIKYAAGEQDQYVPQLRWVLCGHEVKDQAHAPTRALHDTEAHQRHDRRDAEPDAPALEQRDLPLVPTFASTGRLRSTRRAFLSRLVRPAAGAPAVAVGRAGLRARRRFLLMPCYSLVRPLRERIAWLEADGQAMLPAHISSLRQRSANRPTGWKDGPS
jgi:hypothetical protein